MRFLELCADCQRKARGQSAGPTVADIIAEVSKATLIAVADIKSARTTKAMVKARYVAMAIAYRITGHSSSAIGKAFGGRDHTTVLEAARKLKPNLDACQQKLPNDATAAQWARAMVQA